MFLIRSAWLTGLLILTEVAGAQDMQTVPYDLEHPAAIHKLDKDLREISGLTTLDENTLGAIQDEDGKLYLLHPASGKVIGKNKFGKDGDYEGIARAGDRLFVVKSNGNVVELVGWQSGKLVGKTYKTSLRSRHDVEGLAYDAVGGRLLLACKGFPGKGLRGKKAIYAFALSSMTLDETPAYLIGTNDFNVRYGDKEGDLNGLVRSFFHGPFELSGFTPSALAVHPITGELYVVSSKRHALVVINRTGEVVSISPLSDTILPQPEGITFLPNGDLFLASEAASRKRAFLVRYTYMY